MRARSTGVDIIDELLGGITPGLPCVLAGPSGSGRTVLSLQLAAASVEQGRVVAFLCNEPAPLLLRQASTLGLNLERAIETERLALLEMDAEIAAVSHALGSDALIEAVRAEQPLCSLLIVDPLSVITAGIFDESRLRAMARGLVANATDWMIVLTVESERIALQPSLERVLGEICGAFLELSRDEDGTRQIRVQKTRNGVPQRHHVSFEIGPGGTRLIGTAAASAPATPQPSAPLEVVAPPIEATRQTEAERGHPTDRRDADRSTRSVAAIEPVEHADRSEADERREAPRRRLRAAELDHDASLPLVLVVDHDRESRERIGKWLEGRCQVHSAEDGFEAMTWLMSGQPDLVILDLMMPRVTGYELLSAMQRTGQRAPRLVISDRIKRPADRLSPLVLGATDILPKPFERFEFLQKVEMLLRLDSAPADLMDPLEAEHLFARVSKTRLMAESDFNARLERACSLGERVGPSSSLVAVASNSSRRLDQFVEAIDPSLRFEDAVLRVSPRRAVILLVATDVEQATAASERLCEEFRISGGSPEQLNLRISVAQRVAPGFSWPELFRGVRWDEDDPEVEA